MFPLALRSLIIAEPVKAKTSGQGAGLDRLCFCRGAAKANKPKGSKEMSKYSIIDIVEEVFDEDLLREAVVEKVRDMIDYEDLAEEIVEENELEIRDIIAAMIPDLFS